MTRELQHIFNEFERKIREEDKLNPDKDDPNGKYSFYIPKIRDYLMIYLNEQIVSRNYAERERLYFEKVFNREYLIEATMYYVENCKTRGVTDNINEKRFSSISDFLIAYNHFYDIVLKLQYTMPVLLTEELSAEIRVHLENKGYVILESEQFPAIQQKEYEYICNFYNNQASLHGKQLQVWIILQISFLYGLSFSTIRNLQMNNIDLDTRTLKILNKTKDENILLDLPYLLFKNIELHIKSNSLENNDLLFFTRNTKNDTQQKPISSTFLSESFKAIKEQYFSQQTHDEFVANRFTHYGVIKYAIANMLEFNMNISSIVNLTGRDTKFILSCKPQNALSSKQQSNYINCIMRSINTYKDYNY